MWQVSLSTTAEAEEAVCCLLERVFKKPASVYWHEKTGARTATVYAARHPTRAKTVLRGELAALRECGLDPGPEKISVKLLPRQNWAESWKRHFKPIEIGRALLIKPGWIKRRPKPGQHVIVLDPGLSFGTGQHPTTFFCLRQLVACRKAGAAQSFLDIGTGSGILAIAAAKLGYATVEAFDFDPASVRCSQENVKKNKVQSIVKPQRRDLTKMPARSGRKFDVICANLTWDLLIGEAAKIVGRLKPGGRLIIAGILQSQFEEVSKNFHKFNLTEVVVRADTSWKSGRLVLLQRA